MKIHEYQARNLFRKYGIPVPEGVVCHSVKEVEEKVPNDEKAQGGKSPGSCRWSWKSRWCKTG